MASIRKRARARGREVYEVDYTDATGRRRRLTAKSREAAEQLRAEKVREASQAMPTDVDRDVILSEYATSWTERLPALGLAESTTKNYAQMLRLYILPELGQLKVRHIHRAMLRNFLARKRQQGLGKNTVRLIRATLSSLLTDALDDGIILANPALALGRKRNRGYALNQADRRVHPLADDQLRALLDAAARHDSHYHPYFMALALAGLRPGEGLGLQWHDFDFASGHIAVRRAIKDGTARAPKTYGSRVVDLHPELAAGLRRLRASQQAESLERGGGWRDDAYVFQTRSGRPPDLANVEKALKRTLKKAGLPLTIRLYDLRHTFATALLSEGAPITYVAAQMGHAKPTTTLQWYAHWIPRGDRRYVDRLLAGAAAELGHRTTDTESEA
jgi:integrase